MSSRTDQHPARDRSPLDLPPGYEAIALREVGDAFVHAREIAAERGAGTLVWVRRFDRIEFAVVLEPDEALAGARRVLYAVLNATADALGAYAPPEKPVAFEWPATLRLDGGILGGAQLAWPEGTPEDAVPAWLVAGVTLRALVPLAKTGALPGHHPLDERLI